MGRVYRVRFQFGEIRKSWRWKVAMFAQLNVLGTAHLQVATTVPFYVMWISQPNQSHVDSPQTPSPQQMELRGPT